MKAFRIGRKPPGIWTNRTPPIRGGVFTKDDEEIPLMTVDTLDSSEDSSITDSADGLSETSLPTSLSSIGSDTGDDVEKPGRASPWKEVSDQAGSPPSKVFVGNPIAFTAWAEQQDITRDMASYPPVDPVTQQNIAMKYKALADRVQAEGYYECRYIEYGREAVRYTLLFTLTMVGLYKEWYMSSAFFLGLFWHQVMFTAHDAGHRAITSNFEIDSLIGIFIGDFLCGLSIGWWKRSHNPPSHHKPP
jgi:sphingolipid 8-(E)-desaturase